MKCKVGDICRIISPDSPNRDRLLVIRAAASDKTALNADWICETMQTFQVFRHHIRNGRVYDVTESVRGPGYILTSYDKDLEPIRDTDGQDEMIGIAGKPPAVKLTPPVKKPEKVS